MLVQTTLQCFLPLHPDPATTAHSRFLADALVQSPGPYNLLLKCYTDVSILLGRNGRKCGPHGRCW